MSKNLLEHFKEQLLLAQAHEIIRYQEISIAKKRAELKRVLQQIDKLKKPES